MIFTDGADNLSWLPPDRVADAAARSDLVFYGVVLVPDLILGGGSGVYRAEQPANPPDTPQYRFLKKLAAESGGRVMSARWAGLRDTLQQIVQELRTRYLVTYYPSSSTPGWHRVEVKLIQASGEVRTRRGYYAAGSPRQPRPAGRTP